MADILICPFCRGKMQWFMCTLVCPKCDEYGALRELQWAQDMQKGIKYCKKGLKDEHT